MDRHYSFRKSHTEKGHARRDEISYLVADASETPNLRWLDLFHFPPLVVIAHMQAAEPYPSL